MHTREAFENWSEASLSWLIEKAKKSGKDFGSSESLLAEYKILKRRMLGNDKLVAMTEVSRWNKVCRSSVYYSGCENILNLALACFIKSPNESIVESVGSVINQHGKKSRSSMKNENLDSELFIAWNGPEEMSSQANDLIERAIKKHFKDKPLHFYSMEQAKSFYQSTTVTNHLKKPSRVQ